MGVCAGYQRVLDSTGQYSGWQRIVNRRRQGFSVALSADGNTALVGSNGAGAWAFVRDSSGNWTQQGSNLIGSGASSVALSADGNTALVGDGEPGGGAVAVVLTRDSGGALA